MAADENCRPILFLRKEVPIDKINSATPICVRNCNTLSYGPDYDLSPEYKCPDGFTLRKHDQGNISWQDCKSDKPDSD